MIKRTGSTGLNLNCHTSGIGSFTYTHSSDPGLGGGGPIGAGDRTVDSAGDFLPDTFTPGSFPLAEP